MTQKLIVLTGATRGLGRALVREFVAAGHTVLGCGRNAEQIAELTKLNPTPHAFAAVDVRDSAAVTKWATESLAKHGPPDLLINNAAIINNLAPLWKVPEHEFNELFNVNVLAVANVIRAWVPAMVQRRSGVIVNLSSGWGRSVSAEVAPYCGTKYAVEGLTLAMAAELPSGMAAIPLNPGIINTDMLRQCFGASAAQYPTPEVWAKRAAPFILNLSEKDNGCSLSVM